MCGFSHCLEPCARRRDERLQKYLELERHRKEHDEKERQVDLVLHAERRPVSNWLENRENRMSALALECQRALIATRMELRKRLAQECPDLLSDTELRKLENSMLDSVRAARLARRDDYHRRALAAGVPMFRPEERDAAEYGDVSAFVRRETRKLLLDRSLGRTAKPI